MWKQLETVEHRAGPRKSISIVFCGWDPGDPRRDEYVAYRKAHKIGEPDPAMTNLETTNGFDMYSFDHTKVPKSEGSS